MQLNSKDTEIQIQWYIDICGYIQSRSGFSNWINILRTQNIMKLTWVYPIVTQRCKRFLSVRRGEKGEGERKERRSEVWQKIASTGSLIPTVRRGGIPASLLEVSPTVTKLSIDTAERWPMFHSGGGGTLRLQRRKRPLFLAGKKQHAEKFRKKKKRRVWNFASKTNVNKRLLGNNELWNERLLKAP